MTRGLAAYSCGGSPGFAPEFPFHPLSRNLSRQLHYMLRRTPSIWSLPVLSVHLVLGGARSGKSAFAQSSAEAEAARTGGRLVMIATAQAFDAEMGERIARHRLDRGPAWTTVESPVDLPEALEGASDGDIVVVDCLTLWLSNLMLEDRDISAATARLTAATGRVKGALWLVSNEVGFGIVPDNALARRFRDEAGRLHQTLAQAAAAVTLVVAGLTLKLK